jgi:D-xylose transport system substrate-binding protein
MRGVTRTLAACLVASVGVGGLIGCDSRKAAHGPPPRPAKVGVILPNSRSATHWETVDRPSLQAAFIAAGVPFVIQNAQGDPTAFRTIAEQMIAEGVTVLMITSLDSGSGGAVLAEARAHNVATIDYDRLTLGGGADYFVGFDNVKAGVLLAEGLARCLTDRDVTAPVVAELDGSPTDYNATLFKKGYDSVLGAKYRTGEYVRGPDRAVPDGDRAQAATTFQQMLADSDHLDGVVAATDTLAAAVIGVLRSRGLAGTVAVTGQDATLEGLRQVLAGEQCLTVYKPSKKEAAAAADLAVTLAKGQRRPLSDKIADPQRSRDVPAVLLAPRPIVSTDVKDLVADGFVNAADLCTSVRIARCRDLGIR